MKGLQLGKQCRREQRQMANAILEPVGVMHRDGGAGIVPNHVPFVDTMFRPDSLDLLGKRFQLVQTATICATVFRGSPEAGGIDSHAREPSEQLVVVPAPKLTTGRYAVNEQDWITGTARKQIHAPPLIPAPNKSAPYFTLAFLPRALGVCRADKTSTRLPGTIEGITQEGP